MRYLFLSPLIHASQMIPTTIVSHGCDWRLVDDLEYARQCAMNILQTCKPFDVYDAAVCYNHDRSYARTIEQEYAQRMRNRSWARILMTKEGP